MFDEPVVTLIKDRPTKTVVDALYYAARFIKQASRLGREFKDIFDEDFRSAPAFEVKDLTRSLISAIETAAGRPAASFDHLLVVKAVDALTSAVGSLDTDLSPAEEQRAQKVIGSMGEPTLQTLNSVTEIGEE